MAIRPWSARGSDGKKGCIKHRQDKRRLRRDTIEQAYGTELLEKRAMMAVVAPTYEVVHDWGTEFEANIRLHNGDTEAVNDWSVSFKYEADISSIWGATIVAREGDRYTIANEGWNANLEAGRSVAFGFIGSASIPAAQLASPVNYVINGEALDTAAVSPVEQVVPSQDTSNPNLGGAGDSYHATFNEINNWGSGFIGEVVVQNKSDHMLAGWMVEFDFAGELDAVWNGKVVARSGSRYTVRGPLWNPDVSPGGAVSFRVHGASNEAESILTQLRVTGICNGPEPRDQSVIPAVLLSPRPRLAPSPDTIDGDGRVFMVDPTHVDISDFDPAHDRLSFGQASSHGLVLAKTASGEPAVLNLWADAPQQQIISGVTFDDLTVANFSVVMNEHLRQDIGGALSWERGVGPRDARTIYIRSHEVGVHERIEGFDPDSMKLSFLYYSSRERIFVEDTAEGLLLSSKTTGQSTLLVGVSRNQLVPFNIEFHHDQIVESQLEESFGLSLEQVAMVSRSGLLTPESPVGAVTDGDQVRYGVDDPRNDQGGDSYTEVASTTEVRVLVDDAGLAYVSDSGGDPIGITRADSYWQGSVPVIRDGASLMAAARDDLGRLRLLDGSGSNVYAWILDENGHYVGEEGPGDTSLRAKESLFQIDIDGDGAIETVAGVNSGNEGDERWGEAYFAPYVDMGFWVVPNLTEIAATRGTSLLTLAFILSTTDGKAAWAGWDSLTLDSESERAVAINDSISAFQDAGGSVMISFGGAAGNSLAHVHASQGKTAQELANVYIDVVNKYSLNRIDFDIEGSAIADPVSIALRSEALALFQEARPDVEVWYTLPALPTGLTYNGFHVIRSALQAGVVLDGVNLMTMDYGEWAAPTTGPNAQTMGYYAISSAEGAHNQLSSMYSEYGHQFGWSQLGVTPMIGVNDVLTEIFTIDDAHMLEDFARNKGLGMLSMWSIARDNPGSLGQASATASGLDLPAGSYSSIFYDYGTQNGAISYTEVAATTEVSVLVDYLGLVSLSDSGGPPISITRSDSYWQGKIPLSRNGATILAAARDELGRLRVLDGTGTDVYAWILDENGFYQGEEGPSDTSLQAKEVLFQIDIDGDGIIG
ncbi:MAG: cellulose binding domain-containing protein [Pirellulales bacterium]|nr:cellulose binding domain-containing protein [Pirellulales bacterium]